MKCLRSAMVTHKNAVRHTTGQLVNMNRAWETWFTLSKGVMSMVIHQSRPCGHSMILGEV